MVELIDSNQSVIERRHTVSIDCEAEGCMGADQHLIVAVEERAQRLDLAAVIVARRIAQVPLRFNLPISPKAVLRQRFAIEAGTDGLFRYNNDGLLQALVV